MEKERDLIMNHRSSSIAGINALKGFAILAITFFHLFPAQLTGGWLGVCLFFVLSGFLLALSSERKAADGTYTVRAFYKSRIIRIYPSLLLVLILTIGFCVFFAPAVIKAIRPEFLSIVFGYNNFWQIVQNMDYFTRVLNASPFSHMWFLSILLQFYMVWPLLFGLYRLMRKRKGWLFAVGTFFVLSVVLLLTMPLCYGRTGDITRCYYGTDTRIGALVLGATGGFLVRKLYDSKLSAKKETWRIMLFVFFGIVLAFGIAFFTLDGQNALAYWFGIGFFTLASFVLVVLCALPQSPIGRLISNPVLNWCGKNSLLLFLWQYPVIYLFSYFHLGSILLAPVWELLLILILTTGTNRLLSRSFRKKEWRKRPVRLGAGALTAILCMAGIYGLAVSEQSKMNDQQQLALRLKENEKSLQASHTASKESNNPSVPDTKDYTGSGNSRKVELEGVVLVGDSVMLSASDQIMNVLPSATINAEVGRHLGQEQAPLQEILDDGAVHQTVVAGLGTNGILYDFAVEELIALIGEERSIFFINAYCPTLEWEQSNNSYLTTLPQKHANVTIIDWYSLASQHPEWFFSDSTHPNEEGSKAYAELIRSSLKAVADKQ